MATGGEPASAGNVKAFYETLRNGGVSEGFIKDLKALRKAMGLGDTLGKVPMDCLDVALADSVDDSTIGQQMAVTPKGVYEYMMHKEGGFADVTFENQASGRTVTANPVFSHAMCDGETVSIKSNKIDVARGGFYEIAVSPLASYASKCAEFSILLVVNGTTVSKHSKTFTSTSQGTEFTTDAFTDEVYIPSGAFVEIKVFAEAVYQSSTYISSTSGSMTIKRV